MIKAKITKNRLGQIISVQVSGHAIYGEYGEDIICSAISVYLTNTINTLTELVKVEDNLEYEIGEGHFLLNIDYSNMDSMEINDTTLILESLKLALISIEDSYGEYIKIVTGEVQ
ncbi:ribosomal-processing cysteine protease Prp [Lagierella sp.]|uniref:ribosomal-processing cysteine protease Prp n=1 Tax=Lagierella sp. TaxID=2849657 RepID=UPI0026273548|nr:ribosomal-processing cysteine protease Prp [Lagierella sp.]